MILAAGRGARLHPLTRCIPKPLLQVHGEVLIERQIRQLCAAGTTHIVINLHHLGEMIAQQLGDGRRWGVRIVYSHEDTLLGSVGGIAQAVHRGLLTAPFVLANADIYSDYPYASLSAVLESATPDSAAAHLILIPNPSYHPHGDFSITAAGKLALPQPPQTYTYAGIGVYHPDAFATYPAGQPADFLPFIHRAITAGTATARVYRGSHADLGTPARLLRALS